MNRRNMLKLSSVSLLTAAIPSMANYPSELPKLQLKKVALPVDADTKYGYRINNWEELQSSALLRFDGKTWEIPVKLPPNVVVGRDEDIICSHALLKWIDVNNPTVQHWGKEVHELNYVTEDGCFEIPDKKQETKIRLITTLKNSPGCYFYDVKDIQMTADHIALYHSRMIEDWLSMVDQVSLELLAKRKIPEFESVLSQESREFLFPNQKAIETFTKEISRLVLEYQKVTTKPLPPSSQLEKVRKAKEIHKKTLDMLKDQEMILLKDDNAKIKTNADQFLKNDQISTSPKSCLKSNPSTTEKNDEKVPVSVVVDSDNRLAQEPTFIRLKKDNEKVIALETATTRYVFGQNTVDLIGVVHIGDKVYYQQLQKQFAQYDALLYELVAEPGTKPKKDPGMSASKIFGLILDLDTQLSSIDYDKQNFIHADLSFGEMMKEAEKRGETKLTLGLSFLADILKKQTGEKHQFDVDLQKGFLNPNLFKREFAKQLTGKISLGATADQLIVVDRNKHTLNIMTQSLEKNKKKIGIFYGAAHMPDFHKRLTKDYNMTLTNQTWLTAWDMSSDKEDPAARLMKILSGF